MKKSFTKPDHWKQPTPAMQLIANLGNFEGRIDNAAESEVDTFVIFSIVGEFVNDLKTLQPFLEAGSWTIKPTEPS